MFRSSGRVSADADCDSHLGPLSDVFTVGAWTTFVVVHLAGDLVDGDAGEDDDARGPCAERLAEAFEGVRHEARHDSTRAHSAA